MSSVDTSVILAAISAMESQLAALKAQLSGKTPAASGKSSGKSSAPKEKKERSPSGWILFTQRVRTLLREADYEKKSLGPELVLFCGSLKEENTDYASWADEDILARRAAWSAPEIRKKGSAAASVASAPEEEAPAAEDAPAAEAPKKRGPPKGVKLSEEQKAQRKATREANKAKKEVASDAEEEAPASDAEGSTTSSQKKKRGPKKFSEMTPEELSVAKAKREENKAKKEAAKKETAPASPTLSAATLPLPPSPPLAAAKSSPIGFQPVMLGRVRYWVNLQSGHAYHRSEDNAQGHWAGLFSKSMKRSDGTIGPGIDHSVAEPEAELSFDLEA